MIVAMSLVERLVPEQRLTEGMTWLLAGLNVGVALGAAFSGHVVDAGGRTGGLRRRGRCRRGSALLVAMWGHRRLSAHGSPAWRAA